MFRQQPRSKSLHHGGGFDPGPVVGEALFRIQPGHPDVQTLLFWISVGV
jgi:hypothetical protein